MGCKETERKNEVENNSFIFIVQGMARPQTLTPEQIQQVVNDFEAYIEREEDPTIVGFCASYPPIILSDNEEKDKVHKHYINKNYIGDHDEFSELRNTAIQKQEAYLLKWATSNKLNTTMSIFRLKQPQHWYKDRQEIEHSWKIEWIKDISITVSDD